MALHHLVALGARGYTHHYGAQLAVLGAAILELERRGCLRVTAGVEPLRVERQGDRLLDAVQAHLDGSPLSGLLARVFAEVPDALETALEDAGDVPIDPDAAVPALLRAGLVKAPRVEPPDASTAAVCDAIRVAVARAS